jgi:hypothetical protein
MKQIMCSSVRLGKDLSCISRLGQMSKAPGTIILHTIK